MNSEEAKKIEKIGDCNANVKPIQHNNLDPKALSCSSEEASPRNRCPFSKYHYEDRTLAFDDSEALREEFLAADVHTKYDRIKYLLQTMNSVGIWPKLRVKGLNRIMVRIII